MSGPERARCARPSGACLNGEQFKTCLVCPLRWPCSCGAGVGQRCRRPSGHSGPMVATHEYRLRLSDREALQRYRDYIIATFGAAYVSEWETRLGMRVLEHQLSQLRLFPGWT